MNYFKPIFNALKGKKPEDSLRLINEEAEFFAMEGKKLKILDPQTMGEEDFQGKSVRVDGKEKIDLTRLDYLALGSSSEIKNIIINALNKNDLSCPASQMVMKSFPTTRLENKLSEFHSMKSTVLFTNGYSVNDNLMQALGLRLNTHYIANYLGELTGNKAGKSLSAPTILFMDAESHYSLHHGARIAKYFSKGTCQVMKFPCMDYESLQLLIQKSEKMYPQAIKIIVSDALSSISGRIFDIDRLYQIANEHNCLIYLDEAHSTGVLGPQGRGVAYAAKTFEQNKNRTIIMGTLTKAFCQLGGYVTVNNENLGILLRTCSPQYIFSAPITPWVSDAISDIIDLTTGNFGELRRKKLKEISEYMRDLLVKNSFDILGSNSQIIPVFIGDDRIAQKMKADIENDGFIASLFIHPAVPKNNALVRFSLCADVKKEEIDRVVEALIKAREKHKINTT